MSTSLRPIKEPYPQEIARVLSRYPQPNGQMLSLFRTFANSLRFLERGVPNLLDNCSPLPLRVREIVILRVTANNRCEYEWGVHVAIFAESAGFSNAQISSTVSGKGDFAPWSAKEANLIACIDELCAKGCLGEHRGKQFATDWTVEEQLEILALCGAYQTVSYVGNVAGLEPEPFAARFPA